MIRIVTLAALAAVTASGAGAREVGTVAALNKEVQGTPPAAQPRRLIIGENVVQDELIESSPIGSGQLLFLDQTTLTIARNSSIVLDRYVYDPETRTGEVALSMSKGVLRFIGGRITKNTDAVIQTPSATIGIRGGMAIITVEADGSTTAMHVAGEYTRVTSSEGTEVVVTRGNGVVEVPIGGPAAFAGVAGRDFIAAISRDLIGRGEAGEKVDPTNPDVVESGIEITNSAKKNAVRRRPVSTTGESAEDDDAPDELIFITRNEEEVATGIAPDPEIPLDGVTGGASLTASGIGGLTTDAGVEFPFEQVFEGSRIGVTADGDSFVIPTLDRGFTDFVEADGGFSPEGAIEGRVFFDPDAEFTYSVFATEAGSTGAFLAGVASAPPAAAPAGSTAVLTYSLSDDLFFGELNEGELIGAAPFLPGDMGGFDSAGGTDLFLILDDGPEGGAGRRALYGYLDINGAGPGQTSGLGVLTAEIFDTESGQPSFADDFVGVFNNGDGSQRNVIAAARPVEDGRGSAMFGPDGRYFAISNGGFEDDGDVIARASVAFGRDGDLVVYGGNTIATLEGRADVPDEDRAPAGGLMGFAAVSAANGGPGPYAAYNFDPTRVTFDGLARGGDPTAEFRLNEIIVGENEATVETLRIGFGGSGGAGAYLDADRFAMQDNRPDRINGKAATGEFVLATSGLVGDGGVFPEGVDTAPDFMTWGWWGGALTGGDSVNPAVREQDLSLGVWVGGDLTAEASLPAGGVATYEGFAVVSATQDGATFVDGAGFGLSYDFGRGAGTVNFTDLLGDNPVVAVSREGGGYTGIAGIEALGQPGLIAVDGAFFSGTLGTGGAIGVQTNNGALRGAGVFAGDRTSFVDTEPK